MKTETLQTLRNRQPLRLFDTKDKTFIRIQLNKKEKFVCWEKWVSKDKQNWVNHNLYLSLKDVDSILADLRKSNKEYAIAKLTEMQFLNHLLELGETAMEDCSDFKKAFTTIIEEIKFKQEILRKT